MSAAEVVRVAERALLVRFHDDELARAVARSHALRARLGRAASPELEELVLGAGSLLLRFDAGIDEGALLRWQRRLEGESARAGAEAAPRARASREVEVEFGGAAGPDLAEVARSTSLPEREVVARLCAAPLTVAFVGFSPGFPYLIGIPAELQVERLASPRARVAAGTVAIAGPFAGIYPSATPGGWRLLGRTEISLFDASASPPARLAPGDRVRLVAR